MRNLSLATAMSAFIKRPELLELDQEDTIIESKSLREQHMPPARLDRLSQEIELFMAVDPILASLHKEYIDACGILDDLAAKSDANSDPMASVACDKLSSAHSSFSARLIELREDEKVQAMVAMKRHRLLLEEMQERQERRRIEREKSMFYQKSLKDHAKRQDQKRNRFAMDLFMAYMMMCWAMHNASRQELKYDFDNAFIHGYAGEGKSSAA